MITWKKIVKTTLHRAGRSPGDGPVRGAGMAVATPASYGNGTIAEQTA